jgi:hypothetical protein
MPATRKLIMAAMLVAGLGCRDASAPAVDQPGDVIVSLTTAHAHDGALFLTLRGPRVTADLVDHSAYTTFAQLAGADALRIIIVGDSVGVGPLFTVRVGAANRLSAYSVTIEQVATRDDSLRADVSGYAASVSIAR